MVAVIIVAVCQIFLNHTQYIKISMRSIRIIDVYFVSKDKINKGRKGKCPKTSKKTIFIWRLPVQLKFYKGQQSIKNLTISIFFKPI